MPGWACLVLFSGAPCRTIVEASVSMGQQQCCGTHTCVQCLNLCCSCSSPGFVPLCTCSCLLLSHSRPQLLHSTAEGSTAESYSTCWCVINHPKAPHHHAPSTLPDVNSASVTTSKNGTPKRCSMLQASVWLGCSLVWTATARRRIATY